MAEKRLDTRLVDKAIIFATNAHEGAERRGKGFPYIVHPLEAMAIVSTITNDAEILAAATLHDVVEDTKYTIEDIRREFGERVAELVASESDNVDPAYSKDLSWKDIKVLGFKRIKNATRDEQIVAIGDKLSNMRAIYLDWLKYGDEIWKKFHESDPSVHAWRYYQLSNCFDKIEDTFAVREFKYLVRATFGEYLHEFKIEKDEKIFKIYGKINEESANLIAEEMNKIDGESYLDFENVAGIDNAAVRVFFRLSEQGKRFYIRNANENILFVFYKTGVDKFVSITEKPAPISLDDYTLTGDGYTALSYTHKSGDSMMKLYAPFIRPEEVEKERTVALRVLSLGVNTPLCDGLVSCNGQTGISFELIKNKRSIARAISQEPEKLEHYAHLFTKAVKELHQKKCDKTLFNCVNKSFRDELEIARDHFTDDEYQKILELLKNAETSDTCIHGDLHIGNVITTPNEDVIFIDMADFAWGNPLYDVATFYVMAHIISPEQVLRLYHITQKQMQEVWKCFVKEYFNVKTNEEIQAIENTIKPYAGIRIIQFANRSKWRDGSIANNIKKLIFGYKEENR